jgi:hypothetical protein
MYSKQTFKKTTIHLHDLLSKSHAGASVSKVKWSKAQKESRQPFKQAFRVAVSDFLQGRNLLEKK